MGVGKAYVMTETSWAKKILIFWKMKLDIYKYNNRLRKFTETSPTSKITDKICLNYEILRRKIWNMSHKIFLKDGLFIIKIS